MTSPALRFDYFRAHRGTLIPAAEWHNDTASLLLIDRPGSRLALGLGEPSGVGELLRRHVPVIEPDTIEAPLGALAQAALPGFSPAFHWYWLFTTSAPTFVHPLEPQVCELTDLDLVQAIVADGYPHRYAGADDTGATFLALPAEQAPGGYAAVIAAHSHPATTTLAGLAVRESFKRRGLGTALMLAATRWAVARTEYVDLGVFSNNEVARDMYLRLGYRQGMDLEVSWPVSER